MGPKRTLIYGQGNASRQFSLEAFDQKRPQRFDRSFLDAGGLAQHDMEFRQSAMPGSVS